MKIINDNTPTSELASIKIGDEISNGLGTFGEVKDIKFNQGDSYWEFIFQLQGGGLIEAKKINTHC